MLCDWRVIWDDDIMGLGVCHECGVILWCSVRGNEFYGGVHAANCTATREEGYYKCPECGKDCNGLVNDKYCVECWEKRDE